MTLFEAQTIYRSYHHKINPTEEERFQYLETLDFLIHKTKDPDYMVELGSVYYEQRSFDLALKYYEMAAEYDNLYAISNLGYIWYYGRTGERNYEKAFYYFDKARSMGDMIAAYKVADMYKNGYYVQQDMQKYQEIIEELYPKVKNARRLDAPLPEIFTRLAKIRSEAGRVDESLQLYDQARDFLAQRIQGHPFFGDLNIMKWMIGDVYRLRPFDPETADLYDLYYLAQHPGLVTFSYEGEPHEVESVLENGQVVIRFDEKWYRTIDDFFQKAELDDVPITTLYEELLDFKVVRAWN